ncbi:MAG: hypothetical protein PHP25_03365 [Candidatus Moranbacteria bacterium]|nr:hypothetical protein [Candidatus Moranbacteria bacterium]
MTSQLAEADGKQKPKERRLQGPAMNAVCRIIGCELFLHCLGECAYPFQKFRIEKELKDSGHIIFCTFVLCGECGTINGHSNCGNRFGTPRINCL